MPDNQESNSSDQPEQEPGPTRENINPQSIEGLFLVALEMKTPAERSQFLDEKCGSDLEQRRRVEALLLAYDDAGSFLEKSPVGVSESKQISLDFLTPSDNPDLMGTLGKYEIYEVIGQGGMGIVFRALDPTLNRVVAVKVMSPLLAINPNARKRFLREAQAAAAVSHPHIVTIHAVDEDKLPYLVMEYVVGQSLQEKLDKTGALQVTEILRIGTQIAEGLAAAHKQGLIHRDIKPANILLENGVERVKITDFGLARAVDDVTITKTGEVSGTPQYMSPEQASGERVDQRTDLFSLGAVLYALCTGRSPFRASNLAAVVRRVCDDTPRPIEEVNEDIPEWLIEIVNCLLEKQPEARLQTANEVADLLGHHLAVVQQPGILPVVKPKVKRLRHQPIDPTPRERSESETPVQLKYTTPGTLIGSILLALFVGAIVARFVITPLTSDVKAFDGISKFTMTLIFIVGLTSLIRWFKVDQKEVAFSTWFLSLCSTMLAIWLGFMAGVVLQSGRPFVMNTSNFAVILSTLLIFFAISGFAIRGLWLHFMRQGPEYIKALKAKDSSILIGIGIAIWVLLVLLNWGIATSIYRPQFISSDQWYVVLTMALTFIGGIFVTAGFLMQKSLLTETTGEYSTLNGTSDDPIRDNSQQRVTETRNRFVDRCIVWIGGLLLLVPFFMWLFGIATGRHFASSVWEMVLVSLLFCVPVGMLVIVCGLQNLVRPESKSAKILDGLFLLACFFAGPLGILLYIARYIRRKDLSQTKPTEEKQNRVKDELIVEEHRRSNKQVILGVGLGVVALMGMFIFAFAYRHLNAREQYLTINWGMKLIVVGGMFGAAYYIRRYGAASARKNPWNVMGWVMVILACLYSISMIVQPNLLPGSDEVVIDYDREHPVKMIVVNPDTINSKRYYCHKRPFKLKLAPGKYSLQITFNHPDGQKKFIHQRRFIQEIVKKPGKQLMLDMGPRIKHILNNEKFEREQTLERRKNRGAILLSGQLPGLRAGIFPVDLHQAFPEDGVFGFADRFHVLEPMTFEVPAGDYDIKVSSANMGWVLDGHGPQYPQRTIKVKPGEIIDVDISRDYKKLAENQPNWSLDPLFKFVWPVDSNFNTSKRFTLSVQEAKVVQQLFEAFADGKPEVPESELLKTASKGLNLGIYKSLKQKFNDGKHPAWGTLIVPGKTENTYRLVDPEPKQLKSKSER